MRRTLAAAALSMLAVTAHAQSLDLPPSTPGNPVVEVYSPTFAVVQWQRSSDDRGAVAGYEVLRDEVSLGIVDALSYVDRDLLPGRGYNYVILAVDNAGQRSLRATVRAVTPDAIPSPPSGVRAEVRSRTAAELFWDRSPVFGQRYEVKRDGVVEAIIDGTGYFDDTLSDARPYLFEVISLNRQGERSAPVRLFVDTSTIGNAPTGPLPAGPAAPGGLRAAVYSNTAAEVFWDRPATFGLVYDVRRDGALLTTTDGTSWFDDTLSGGTSYTYEIIAIDRGGRRSSASRIGLTTLGDRADPTDPEEPSEAAPRLDEVANDLIVLLAGYRADEAAQRVHALGEVAIATAIGSRALADGSTTDALGNDIPTTIVEHDCALGGSVVTERVTHRNTSDGASGATDFEGFSFADCRLVDDTAQDGSAESRLEGDLVIRLTSRSGSRSSTDSVAREWRDFVLEGADASGLEIDGTTSRSSELSLDDDFLRTVNLNRYVESENGALVVRLDDAELSLRTMTISLRAMRSYRLVVSGTVTNASTGDVPVTVETIVPLTRIVSSLFDGVGATPFAGELSLRASDGRSANLTARNTPTEELFVDWSYVTADGTGGTRENVPFVALTISGPNDGVEIEF